MSGHNHTILPPGTLPSDVVNVNTILGPFFLAQCFNYALYGALCLQVYIYWLRFPKDLTYIKSLVYSLFVIDTFFIACITHAAWYVLVTNWGNVDVLNALPWTWATLPMSSGIVSCIVQLFFVWRIWKLSRQYTMPAVISFFTLAQCAFALKTGQIALEARNFRYIRQVMPGFWLGGSIIADILISATLVRILWKSQTGFKDTDGMVMRLIRLTVEAAAVPVFAASMKLALIYSYHDNRHLIFCVLLARLYSNSLMAMLNCRDPLFGGGNTVPNTVNGAARLGSTPSSFMSVLKSKVPFSNSRAGTDSSITLREHLTSDQSKAEKVFVHKSTTSYHDVDLEAGIRNSSYSLSSIIADKRDRVSVHSVSSDEMTPVLEEAPMSPATAAAVNWARPQSLAKAGFGTFETRSELGARGLDGHRLFTQKTIAERPTSYNGSQHLDDIFPGK